MKKARNINWPFWYGAVLLALVVQIVLYYWFTRFWS